MWRFFSYIKSHKITPVTSVFLQKISVVSMACLVLLSFVMSSLHVALWQQSDWLLSAVLPAVVTQLTNEQRVENGGTYLQRSTLLDSAAQAKAEHMASEGYFSHYSPTGVSPWYWFDAVGYVYAHAGENLAIHFYDSNEVIKAWMNSPLHRANILNTEYREIGIGVAKGVFNGIKTTFIVQLFGTPALLPEVDVTMINQERIPIRELLPQDTVSVSDEGSGVVLEQAVAGSEVVVAGFGDTMISTPAPSENIQAAESEIISADVYFSYIRTSSHLLPDTSIDDAAAGTSVSILHTVATQPSKWLQYVYILLGSIIVTALSFSILLGWRHHRPREIFSGSALLLLMIVCFYIHTMLTGGAVVL
jgi:hypothetical protein